MKIEFLQDRKLADGTPVKAGDVIDHPDGAAIVASGVAKEVPTVPPTKTKEVKTDE